MQGNGKASGEAKLLDDARPRSLEGHWGKRKRKLNENHVRMRANRAEMKIGLEPQKRGD